MVDLGGHGRACIRPTPTVSPGFHHGNMLVDENYSITGVLDWSHIQIVPVERFAMIPEVIVPSAAPVPFKQAIIELWGMLIEALEKIGREKEGSQSEKRMMSLHRLFASPLSEVVCQCTYSYPWRAIFDIRLILPLLYGGNARWEDSQEFYNERSA